MTDVIKIKQVVGSGSFNNLTIFGCEKNPKSVGSDHLTLSLTMFFPLISEPRDHTAWICGTVRFGFKPRSCC